MLEVIILGFKVVELFECHVFVSNQNRFKSLRTEVITDNFIDDIIFLLFGQFLILELVDHVLSAYFKHKFGGSLHKNSDILTILF
jgi:hypothetical protein